MDKLITYVVYIYETEHLATPPDDPSTPSTYHQLNLIHLRNLQILQNSITSQFTAPAIH